MAETVSVLRAERRRSGIPERRQFPRGGRRKDDVCLVTALEALQLSVSEQFDELIRRCGWSYTRTADIAGVSKDAMFAVLKAEGDAKASTWIRLARVLNCEVRVSIIPKRPVVTDRPVGSSP